MKRKLFRAGAVLACILLLSQSALALVPGGEVIGIELSDGTVTVASIDEELGNSVRQAGLLEGDTITRIDERAVSSAQDIRKALERADGTVELEVVRDGKPRKLTVRPTVTAQGPKLGIYLRQGVTGVGTVTFYDPASGRFGALGHGVNSPDGELVNMEQGKVYRACVLSVKKGEAGAPGQLLGNLEGEGPIGTLTQNTDRGIFGTVQCGWPGEDMALCPADGVKLGKAVIRSTIQDSRVQEYSVEILKIYPNAGNAGRNMLLKVTDPALLSTTGGIVQGMSGSPIIQDGKLIGAVTHVLVNDPTTGYGIFIENMLDAAA